MRQTPELVLNTVCNDAREEQKLWAAKRAEFARLKRQVAEVEKEFGDSEQRLDTLLQWLAPRMDPEEMRKLEAQLQLIANPPKQPVMVNDAPIAPPERLVKR